jgi:alkanesulfonate monooxygenase SsuD/methylene tetrahydromethanopterin reductase-like flavin-dependent oxidoreductase (luciferase family)
VWWSDYGNTAAGFAELKSTVEAQAVHYGRAPGDVSATCAVLVRLPGGSGRQMGAYGELTVEPLQGSPAEIAEHLRAFAAAGADHVQLVVDPINRDSIEWFRDMLAVLDGA